MSNDLKRVGLVFTQEGAVDFKKSLQEINLEMNKNYNQFKLTQAQWDKSTSSTEKLRAQQEYLTNAYEIQQDKVKTLQMQLSDLENAENKNTTAIKKKRDELLKAEVKLADYQNKIKDVENQLSNIGEKIEQFGSKIQNMGNKIERAGQKVSAFSIATGTALVASAKSAIDFEDAFTGVEKTVDGTVEQMAELKQGIRDMAKEIPSSTTEIAGVAEAAGQLGIKTEDILAFTKVMIDLGNSTNLGAEEAASALAKFANITNMSAKDYDKLGATIVALGNNFATTEADIVAMATRLAATGELAGLSQSQILSLATAMSSVGIEAEAGGSAMSKLLKQIQVAVETSNSDLKDFAKVAGMTTKEFKKAFEKDAVGALSAFIGGLNDTKRNGKSAIAILNDMDIKEIRLSNTILSLANASGVMNDAVKLGNKAWEDNSALTNEANKRYATLKSKIQIAWNKVKDLAVTFGNKLTPTLSKAIDKIENLTKWIENLTDEQVEWILKVAGAVTALGLLLTILGKVTSTVGGTIKAIGTFSQALGVINGTVTSTSTAVNGLASVISGLMGPTGMVITALSSLAGAYIYLSLQETDAQRQAKEFANEMSKQKQSLEEYNKSIDDVTNASLAEIDSTRKLKDELIQLVDENGKVKEGYESRVSFILNQLNNALGTEYKLNGNIVKSYQNLREEIDKVITKKEAEIRLSADEEKYKNAIEKQTQAVEDLKTAHENLGMSIDDAKDKYKSLLEEYDKQIRNGTIDYSTAQEIRNLENLIGAYDDAEYRVKDYTEKIQTYQTNYQLFLEGKYDEIGKNVIDSTKSWCDSSLEEIKNSITEQGNALDAYKQIYKETGNEIAQQAEEQAQKNLETLGNELATRTSRIGELGQDEIKAWKNLADKSVEQYTLALSQLDDETQKKVEEATGVVNRLTEEERKAWKNLAETSITEYSVALSQLDDETKKRIEEATGVIANDIKVKDATKKLAKDAERGFRDNIKPKEWGEDLVKLNAEGMTNKKSKSIISSAASTVAGWISSFLHFSLPEKGPLSDMDESMPDMIELMADGIDKNKNKLIKSAHNMAQDVKDEFAIDNTDSSASNYKTNNETSNRIQNIDYDKMANAITKALTNCKFTLDEDGFAKIVKDELYKVV